MIDVSILKDIVTGIDGVTYDVVRIAAVAAVIEALFLAGYDVLGKGRPFDMQAYGIGLGAIFLSVGAALKLKADTEPSDSVSVRTTSETKVTESK